MMDKREQKRFVRELIHYVQTDVLDRIKDGRIPPEWDGIELRQFLSDRFQRAAFSHILKENRKRWKAYKNTVLVNNL